VAVRAVSDTLPCTEVLESGSYILVWRYNIEGDLEEPDAYGILIYACPMNMVIFPPATVVWTKYIRQRDTFVRQYKITLQINF